MFKLRLLKKDNKKTQSILTEVVNDSYNDIQDQYHINHRAFSLYLISSYTHNQRKTH